MVYENVFSGKVNGPFLGRVLVFGRSRSSLMYLIVSCMFFFFFFLF
jgi:hypothetical protein